MEIHMIPLLIFFLLADWKCLCDTILPTAWRPIVPDSESTSIIFNTGSSVYSHSLLKQKPVSIQLHGQEHCTLYKVLMFQKNYAEFIVYENEIPDLKEFTLCMWKKLMNHTSDHPLFSYAVEGQPHALLSWIDNTPRSSFYMMNIDGQNLYRLSYPLQLNKWYHSCQSWNGYTGEWQIWVNDERVGRGFNNRLVGHIIKGGGVAISGQEQRHIKGDFSTNQESLTEAGGMIGEITMVQLYGVALSAGKAHRDHKHHHAHHFEHSNNVPQSTTTRMPVTGPLLPISPFLTAGQLNHQVKINPGANIQIVRKGVTVRHPSLVIPEEAPEPLLSAIVATQPTVITSVASSQVNLGDRFSNLSIDYDKIRADRRKREQDNTDISTFVAAYALKTNTQLGTNGLARFDITNPISHTKYNNNEEREPAEEEVRRVMNICDGCTEEPFEKALIMSWRNVPKKLLSGALHVPASQACKRF